MVVTYCSDWLVDLCVPIPAQEAAEMQQSWQGETAQVGEGTHHPQSQCASPPEAVLPAEWQAAVQALAATQDNSRFYMIHLTSRMSKPASCARRLSIRGWQGQLTC